ncbi:MAG: ATP-binding protein [Acidobacteriota bacterium]
MTVAGRAARPLQREIRLLIGALISFLITLIVALLALAVSILRLDRLTSTADAAARETGPLVTSASPATLSARLDLLRGTNGLSRVEVYRGTTLYAAAGPENPATEAVARPVAGGRMLFYFEVSNWAGARRGALVTGALATIATMAGLLLFILYVPRFVRPVEEMLDQASRFSANVRGDHDARYLVQTFRDAVERIQEQSRELDHLRDAASARSPDIFELARALNASFSSGFLALDAHATVVAINDAGRESLQVSGDPVGRPLSSELFPQAFVALVRGSLDSRTALSRREVLIEPGGSLIGITTVPLFDEGAFLGLFALFTDLASFRAMEGRLRDLEALVGLGQMSAGIAHEFRNSLFTILGYLRLAQRNSTEEQTAKIRSAEVEAQKLAGAVDALLNFSKPLKLVSQRLALAEVTRAVTDRAGETSPHIAFVVTADDSVTINGDRELLELALENIVRNAADSVRQRHPEGGGRIEATVSGEPHPRITIADNGLGVDRERASAYLLPFQSTKAEGVGLGLPLARKIVLQHGGSLAIDGELGRGATVTLEFFP